jgi:hypothetical protein
MGYNPGNIVEKRNVIAEAWRELSPTETFANMTLAEFEAQTQSIITTRENLTREERRVSAAIGLRNAADKVAIESIQLVVNSVRGNPNYGRNSSLYRAMGYVPRDERKSGLTFRRQTAQEEPVTTVSSQG